MGGRVSRAASSQLRMGLVRRRRSRTLVEEWASCIRAAYHRQAISIAGRTFAVVLSASILKPSYQPCEMSPVPIILNAQLTSQDLLEFSGLLVRVNIPTTSWACNGMIPRYAAAGIVACLWECWGVTGIILVGHIDEARGEVLVCSDRE